MSLLDREETAALNISTRGLVLTYAHDNAFPRVAICRISLGNVAKPIAGGAIYSVEMEVNGRRISPDSQISVLSGLTSTIIQSRELLIAQTDEVKIYVTGPPADVAVYALAELLDMTPVTRSEINGTGAVPVDHDYGGTDNLAFQTQSGSGIEKATVQAYLKSDWDAGRRTAAYVRGETVTVTGGRWLAPVMLDPGVYTLLYYRQGFYQSSTRELTVA